MFWEFCSMLLGCSMCSLGLLTGLKKWLLSIMFPKHSSLSFRSGKVVSPQTHSTPCAQTDEISLCVDAKRKHEALSWTNIKRCVEVHCKYAASISGLLWIPIRNPTRHFAVELYWVMWVAVTLLLIIWHFQTRSGKHWSFICFDLSRKLSCITERESRDKDIEDASNDLCYQYVWKIYLTWEEMQHV